MFIKKIKPFFSILIILAILWKILHTQETNQLETVSLGLFSWLFILFFTAFLYLIGQKFLLIIFKINRPSFWAQNILSGFFILNIIFFLLSSLNLFKIPILRFLTLSGFIFTLFEIYLLSKKNLLKPQFSQIGKNSPITWIFLAGVFFIGFYGSLSPLINYDVLVYHLQLPKEYLNAGTTTLCT